MMRMHVLHNVTYARIDRHTPSHTHVYILSYTCVHIIYKYACVRMYRYTYTHTHIYIYTYYIPTQQAICKTINILYPQAIESIGPLTSNNHPTPPPMPALASCDRPVSARLPEACRKGPHRAGTPWRTNSPAARSGSTPPSSLASASGASANPWFVATDGESQRSHRSIQTSHLCTTGYSPPLNMFATGIYSNCIYSAYWKETIVQPVFQSQS